MKKLQTRILLVLFTMMLIPQGMWAQVSTTITQTFDANSITTVTVPQSRLPAISAVEGGLWSVSGGVSLSYNSGIQFTLEYQNDPYAASHTPRYPVYYASIEPLTGSLSLAIDQIDVYFAATLQNVSFDVANAGFSVSGPTTTPDGVRYQLQTSPSQNASNVYLMLKNTSYTSDETIVLKKIVVTGKVTLDEPYLYYSFDSEKAMISNSNYNNFTNYNGFLKGYYSIDYANASQNDVANTEYNGNGFALQGPCTVTAYVQCGTAKSSEDVGYLYGFAEDKMTTPYQPDGTVNAPNIVPNLPTGSAVTYSSDKSSPTNPINSSTGVITINGIVTESYSALFSLPATAPRGLKVFNQTNTTGAALLYKLGSFSLEVTKRNISDCTVSLSSEKYTYYGSVYTPHANVTVGTYYFNEGANGDYTVSSNPSEIKDAGTYTISITPTSTGRLTGSAVTKTFTMEARSFETDKAEVTLGSSSMEYNGSELHPTVSVAFPNPKGGLESPIDASNYTVSYTNATNVGTATVTVTGKGNYKGSASAQFTITAKSLSGASISNIPNQTYTGSAITPEPTVSLTLQTGASATTLTKGTDYTLTYANNTNVGTATITISGKGNYSGTATQTFTIVKATPTVTAPTGKSLTYNGSAQALVNAGSTTAGTLQYSTDGQSYGTSIPSATNAGTYTVYYRVVGDANYNDVAAKSVTATIAKATPSVTAPTGLSLTYNGSAQALAKAGSTSAGTLQYSSDGQTYSTSIPSATNAGTYTVYYRVVGDANNNDVAAKSVTATIAKAAGSISYTTASIGKTYGDAAFTNTLTKTGDGTVSYSSSNTAVATVNASTGEVTIVGNGSTTITATVTDGTNYTYATKTASYTLSVGTATMTVSATGYTGKYDGQPHGITVTAPSGATVKYGTSAGTYNLNASPTYTDVGDYTVYYQVTKTGFDTMTGSAMVSIMKADPRLVYVNYEFTAKIGEPFDAPYLSLDPSDLVVTYRSADPDVADVDAKTGEVTLVSPGKVNIYAEFAGDANYNSASDYYILTVLQRDIDPIVEDQIVTMNDNDFLTTNDNGQKGEVNLENTVIKDILYTLDINGDPFECDGYDEDEHCIVLNHPMTESEVNRIINMGLAPGTSEFAEVFFGLTLKVPAGKGYVIIDSSTDGEHQMMVKIGKLKAVAFNHTAREKDYVLYECSTPTWVYIFNGGKVSNARMEPDHRAKKTKSQVRIYSITRTSSNAAGIEQINSDAFGSGRWYDLQGNRIERPMKKGLYILDGQKVVVK